jgi:soluble P-type ATPase
MTVEVCIPGLAALHLEHLLLDVNGTLTNRGSMVAGVQARVAELRNRFEVHLLSADTFGTLDSITELLDVSGMRAASGEEKLRELDRLGHDRCAVVGNGANDALVIAAAAVGVVVGPEGVSGAALMAADVVCTSAAEALDLLLEPKALAATLRP